MGTAVEGCKLAAGDLPILVNQTNFSGLYMRARKEGGGGGDRDVLLHTHKGGRAEQACDLSMYTHSIVHLLYVSSFYVRTLYYKCTLYNIAYITGSIVHVLFLLHTHKGGRAEQACDLSMYTHSIVHLLYVSSFYVRTLYYKCTLYNIAYITGSIVHVLFLLHTHKGGRAEQACDLSMYTHSIVHLLYVSSFYVRTLYYKCTLYNIAYITGSIVHVLFPELDSQLQPISYGGRSNKFKYYIILLYIRLFLPPPPFEIII